MYVPFGRLSVAACLALLAPCAASAQPRLDAFGDPLPPGALARLGTVRLRHESGVVALAYSPDGKWLASGGNDLTVRIWDAATGEPVRRLPCADTPSTLAYTSDGRVLTAGLGHIWDMKSGKLRFGGPAADVNRLAGLLRDTVLVTVSFGGAVRHWDLATGRQQRVFATVPNDAARATLSHDGKTLALVCPNQRIRVWDMVSGNERWQLAGRKDHRSCLAFSPDSKLLAMGHGQDGQFWDATTGKPTRPPIRTLGAEALTFAPDGKTLAVGTWAGIELWDLASGKRLGHLTEQSFIRSLAFSPDGKVLASGSSHASVWLWDVAARKPLPTPRGDRHPLGSLAFSPDGRRVMTLHHGSARLWDAITGKEQSRAEASFVALSPDGRAVVIVRDSERIALWGGAGGPKAAELPEGAPAVRAVTYSADGNTLAWSADNGDIQVCDVTGKRPPREFAGAENCSLALSPDGKTLACSDGNHTVFLRDVATGKEVRRIAVYGRGVESGANYQPRVYCLAISPDGKSLATCSEDGAAELWDAASGRRVLSFGSVGLKPVALAFSPNGRSLAIADRSESTVFVWEVRTGKIRARFEGHCGPVYHVAFSHDGRVLASVSEDGTALLWDMSRPTPLGSVVAKDIQ